MIKFSQEVMSQSLLELASCPLPTLLASVWEETSLISLVRLQIEEVFHAVQDMENLSCRVVPRKGDPLLHDYIKGQEPLSFFPWKRSNLNVTATITADLRFLDCHFMYFALKCQILISNWDQEKWYIMGNPILTKVKLLSELSILIKVDLWTHHVDWNVKVSFNNAHDKIQWRPVSNTNFLEITTVWVLLRAAEEQKLLSCFFPLRYRTVRARTMKERKVTSCKCLFHGAKQFRVCFLNLLKINTDVYANLQWKEDQIHLPVLVQRGLEKLEERETNKKSVCQRVIHVCTCMPAL